MKFLSIFGSEEDSEESGEVETKPRLLHPGKNIGPYRLEKKLGSGTFGSVWAATRSSAVITTKVAVKIAHEEVLDYDAFLAEARIWAQASGHPNVAPIIEADFFDGCPMLVGELASDGTLADWLRRNREQAPTIPAIVDLITSILKGLQYLHSKGIIHRDLKPSNILMQGDIPRIADFGISRFVDSAKMIDTAGTPLYMAPEAFEGIFDEQTDIWSVGVVMYVLLFGGYPFVGDDSQSTITQIVTEELEIPASPYIPYWLLEVLRKSLEKERSKRFISVEDFLTKLDSILVRTEMLIRPRILPRASFKFDLSNFSPGANFNLEPRRHNTQFAYSYLREMVRGPGRGIVDFVRSLREDPDNARIAWRWLDCPRLLYGLPKNEMIEPAGLSSIPTEIGDSHYGVLIQFPEPQRSYECLFAGIIVPNCLRDSLENSSNGSASCENNVPRYFIMTPVFEHGETKLFFDEMIGKQGHVTHSTYVSGSFDILAFDEILQKYFRKRPGILGNYWRQEDGPRIRARELSFYASQEIDADWRLQIYEVVRKWCDAKHVWHQLTPRTDGFDILMCHPTLGWHHAANELFIYVSSYIATHSDFDFGIFQFGPLRKL